MDKMLKPHRGVNGVARLMTGAKMVDLKRAVRYANLYK